MAAVTAEVVAIRPDVASPDVEIPARPTIDDALDDIEDAAHEAGVLYVDVRLQLALARHLVSLVGRIELGAQPTVAQVHTIRELRITTTELRQLVLDYSTRRR